MLKALYDYAIQHNLVLPPGFSKKPIKAWISLSTKSNFVGVEPGDDYSYMIPDIGSMANGTEKSNVLVEKRLVALPNPDGYTAKNHFFLETLKAAAEKEHLLLTCVTFLEDEAKIRSVVQELDRLKIKKGDAVSFKVDGQPITELTSVKAWWQEYRKQFSGTQDKSSLCLVTGEQAVPLETTPLIGGLGKAKLICFDKNAFCSYGLKQAANAPISEDAFAAVKAALEDLLKDAPSIAGIRFVHWFDRDIESKDDPFADLKLGSIDLEFERDEENTDEEDTAAPERDDSPERERIARQRADSVIHGITGAEPISNLDDVVYHILLFSIVNGRVMIRCYEQGNYRELRSAIEQWREDIRLLNSKGTSAVPNCKLAARLIHLLKYQKTDKKPFERMGKELSGIIPAIFLAIMRNTALPDAVAARSLAEIRSFMFSDDDTASEKLPHPYSCQWLKVYLLRKERSDPGRKKEETLMDIYNINHPEPAYHCGALMAVYARIQHEAMREVKSGVVQRYYASAIQTPALVFGSLSKYANYHFDKIENKYFVENMKKELQDLHTAIGSSIPATLNLAQQSYFALGYYQKSAALEKEKNDRIAEWKEKQTNKVNKTEDH